MQLIDLCSGIGGFSLAAHWLGWETIAFCERDAFCQKVLAKNFPNVPIYDDVFTFPSESFRGRSDVLTAGFPCQPFSAAGKRLGRDDERHLFPQILNIVDAVRPTICVFENVRGLLSIESGRVYAEIITSLEGIGYEVITFCIPASALDAPHRRDRLWIVAHANGNGAMVQGRDGNRRNGQRNASEKVQERSNIEPRFNPADSDAPDARCEYESRDSEGMETDTSKRTASDIHTQRCGEFETNKKRIARNAQSPRQPGGSNGPGQIEYGRTGTGNAWSGENWPEVAARLCTVDDGLSGRLVRPRGWRVNALKAAGNSIVPQIAFEIFKAIEYGTH